MAEASTNVITIQLHFDPLPGEVPGQVRQGHLCAGSLWLATHVPQVLNILGGPRVILGADTNKTTARILIWGAKGTWCHQEGKTMV